MRIKTVQFVKPGWKMRNLMWTRYGLQNIDKCWHHSNGNFKITGSVEGVGEAIVGAGRKVDWRWWGIYLEHRVVATVVRRRNGLRCPKDCWQSRSSVKLVCGSFWGPWQAVASQWALVVIELKKSWRWNQNCSCIGHLEVWIGWVWDLFAQ